MKGLLTKDFLHIKTAYLVFFPYLLFMTVMCAASTFAKGNVPFVAIPFIAIFQSLLPLTMIMDDARTGFDKTALTLPFSRKDYIMEKYLLTLINALASSMLFLIFTAGAALMGSNSITDSLSASLLIFSFSMVLTIADMPFMTKAKTAAGTRKVYAISLVLYGASAGHFMAFKSLKDSIKNVHIPLHTSTVVFAVILAASIISYLISAAFYEKKDI